MSYTPRSMVQTGFRNVIRNGDMQIAQRGTSISYTGDSYKYSLDGWLAWNETPGAGTTTISQVAQADGPPLMQIVVSGHTGTDKSSTLYQKIEDVRTLNGRTVTVSFSAKALSGTPSIYVGFGQYFGSGGSTGVSVSGQTVTLSTTLARYSVTLLLPSTSGKTIGTGSNLELYIGLSEGRSFGNQNNTFSFTDIQVEAGSVATPFERLPFQQQLSWCQRYFVRTGFGNPHLSSWAADSPFGLGSAASDTRFFPFFWHPVPMRAAPTMSLVGTAAMFWVAQGAAGVVASSIGTYARSPLVTMFDITSTASGIVGGQATYFATQGGNTPSIDFSAELV